MRHLKDPHRAFSIFETLLKGKTLVECSKLFNLSGARCRQIANDAAYLLRDFPYVSPEAVPRQNITDARQRLKHREFWLRQIAYARSLNVRILSQAEKDKVLKPLGDMFNLRSGDIEWLISEYHRKMIIAASRSEARRHRVKHK